MSIRFVCIILLLVATAGCDSRVQVKVKGKAISAEDAAKDLIAKIENGKSDDRTNALMQLAEICKADPTQASQFAVGLKHSDSATRMTAIRMLKDLGAKGALAVPDLQAVLSNDGEDALIKKEAQEAIAVIQAAAAPAQPEAK